jgi:hypothetical protein
MKNPLRVWEPFKGGELQETGFLGRATTQGCQYEIDERIGTILMIFYSTLINFFQR